MSARHRTISAVTVNLSDELYLQRLRVLGAWWCLGSSALDPRLLAQYVPLRLSALREAGL
jgi:hypothetical protein